MAAVRLSAADIAHRTLVSGLFGLSVYGCYGIWQLHKERLRLGLVAFEEHEAEERRLKSEGVTEAILERSAAPPS